MILLKNYLQAIKGELLFKINETFAEMHREGQFNIDFETYYGDVEGAIKDIMNIQTLDQLDRFLLEFGTDVYGIDMAYFYNKFLTQEEANLKLEGM